MKKIALFFICFSGFSFGIFGQSNVTNNNTITINGNVYYFRPASTPSSPPPTTGGSNYIGDGSWYGEDAAKAWASIADWAIEKCYKVDSPIRGNSNERVYIHQVHAYRYGSEGYKKYFPGNYEDFIIEIYYWVVRNNDTMENGRRETRGFYFR